MLGVCALRVREHAERAVTVLEIGQPKDFGYSSPDFVTALGVLSDSSRQSYAVNDPAWPACCPVVASGGDLPCEVSAY